MITSNYKKYIIKYNKVKLTLDLKPVTVASFYVSSTKVSTGIGTYLNTKLTWMLIKGLNGK